MLPAQRELVIYLVFTLINLRSLEKNKLYPAYSVCPIFTIAMFDKTQVSYYT